MLMVDEQTTEFLSLDRVKAHLNITSLSHDVELSLIRSVAEEQVQALIGPVLWRTITEVAPVGFDGRVWLAERPVVSVTTVTGPGGAVTDYTSTLARGVLADLALRSGTVTVEYVAGRTMVPDSVLLAGLILAAHLWETQRGTAPTRLDEEPLVETPAGFAIPNRAVDLLLPYMRAPVIR